MLGNILNFLFDSSIKLIDFNTLIILFCLMGVVEGFKELGYIDAISHRLVLTANNLRALMITAVFATYVMSMIVTNDVGLIIMVPFSIQVLKSINRSDKLIKLVVLETMAANLGGMATPIGNPHNLYTYEFYGMNQKDFMLTLLPFVIVSIAILIVIIMLDKNGTDSVDIKVSDKKTWEFTRTTMIVLTIGYMILFVLCLGVVLDLIPSYVPFVIEIIFILVSNKQVIKNINYGLLIKFVILFIIVGNLARIPWISNNLGEVVEGNEFFLGIGLSQFLSNLPVAIMLSKFSTNGYEVMMGANIGGFGTIIASMASVISLEFYRKSGKANLKKYFIEFTKYGLIVLVAMIVVKLCVNLI